MPTCSHKKLDANRPLPPGKLRCSDCGFYVDVEDVVLWAHNYNKFLEGKINALEREIRTLKQQRKERASGDCTKG